jgi:O-antigen/teichoic acid export membrane protein
MNGVGGRAAVISITRLMNQGLILISPMLLTRLLSVEQFGQYREFLLYASVLDVIAGFNIFTSLLRFVAHQPEHRQQYVDQALLMVFGSSTLVIAGTAVLNWIFHSASSCSFTRTSTIGRTCGWRNGASAQCSPIRLGAWPRASSLS